MVGARTPEGFVGYWRIIEMEMWDTEYLDLVVPAFMEFDRERMGEFQFGTVRGWLDCRFGERDRVPVVDFSWEGENDNDSGCGRGWGLLQGNRLEGRLYIHRGDDSAFVASKAAQRGPSKLPGLRRAARRLTPASRRRPPGGRA